MRPAPLPFPAPPCGQLGVGAFARRAAFSSRARRGPWCPVACCASPFVGPMRVIALPFLLNGEASPP